MKRIRFNKGAVLGLSVFVAMVVSFLTGSFYSARKQSGKKTKAKDAIPKFQPFDPNFYMKLDHDGNRVVWIRNSDHMTISKYDFSTNGALVFHTLIKIDALGNPLGGKVFNDSKIEVYRVSYEYRTSDGVLTEERLFGVQQVDGSPVVQPKVPLRRVVYSRDQEGRSQQSVLPDLDENPQQREALQKFPSPFSVPVFANNIKGN